jgi:hypothetical protein
MYDGTKIAIVNIKKTNRPEQSPNRIRDLVVIVIVFSLGVCCDIIVKKSMEYDLYFPPNVPRHLSLLAFGVISCVSRRHDKSPEGTGIRWTSLFAFLFFTLQSERFIAVPPIALVESSDLQEISFKWDFDFIPLFV